MHAHPVILIYVPGEGLTAPDLALRGFTLRPASAASAADLGALLHQSDNAQLEPSGEAQ